MEFVDQSELDNLAELMNRKHQAYIGERSFHVVARHDDQGAYATVTLRNEDESFFYPVEGRLDYEDQELSCREAILFLIDYIDLYFEDFFDNGENLFLPIDWSGFDYEAVSFQLKGQVLNRKVEKLADGLLQS